MTELKTQATTASVMAFLAQQKAARRKDCEQVLQMMESATGEPATLWGGSIVGFGRYAYSNSAGKRCEWPVIGFSLRKQDLSLYLMPGFEGHADLLAALGKHKTGKSCLYLKRLSDVDTDVLKQLIEASVQAMASQRVRS